MREPKRLLSDGATDFERQLLKSVINERPSSMMRSRMQQGLGIAGPITWAGNAKALLGTLGTKSGLSAAIGGIVAAGGLAAAIGVGPFSNYDTDAARTGTEAREASVEAVEAVEAVAPRASSAPVVEAAVLEAPSAAELERNGQLREEIALLDAARVSLQQGARPRALTLLASYSERFPSGILNREANLLRKQAARHSEVRDGRARERVGHRRASSGQASSSRRDP